MTDCKHERLLITRGCEGDPIRLICECDTEWRVFPNRPDWAERQRIRDWLDHAGGAA